MLMNAIEANSVATVDSVNPRSRKAAMRMSGCAIRRCTRTKTTSSAAPRTREAMTAGLFHPHGLACCSPKTIRPIPAATIAAPSQSMRSRRRTDGRAAMATITNAARAIGTLTQKMARQVQMVR